MLPSDSPADQTVETVMNQPPSPPLLSSLGQRLWFLVLVLAGCLPFSTIFLYGRSQGSAPVVVASPLPPLPPSLPIRSQLAADRVVSPPGNRTAPVAPSAAPPTTPPVAPQSLAHPSGGATPKPTYTPEQQAINDRAKASFQPATAQVDSMIEMRVAIVEGAPALALSVDTAAAIVDASGQALMQLVPGQAYTVTTDGAGMAIAGMALPEMVGVALPPGASFRLDDRRYPGNLLLVVRSGQIWAINAVDLKRYLYSVVGSEVSPSWDMEALKAQAVAARSYALVYYFRPVNALYHIGATEYYQVYRGLETIADRTIQAVDATAGQFVSYHGGVVESLYAASDEIVMDAFQGHGMSQLGARDLAEQGYTYLQILNHYYPGTAVARFEVDY
ncbi:SpoIID/LytB domain-containing protein [Trichothermofontia sichuanensis B231]|uniref:SpoIID/LytB domain-containing protein n=1 Tax=Trichothermofontia sichuanensis TaxID=3045816 RepID=UPI0022456A6B|nr:SpoIID/LytB domain-containing protein [Trichothermofontia sichuanensis]UZQ53103.1 SpoIID/LytB domain-containing protein [Trichothermofontia sichuanensis B231]